MKQVMIALLSLMGITDIRYSGRKQMFYVNVNELVGYAEIKVTVGTFYGLAKRYGIQSPTAFALANGNNLVKGRK